MIDRAEHDVPVSAPRGRIFDGVICLRNMTGLGDGRPSPFAVTVQQATQAKAVNDRAHEEPANRNGKRQALAGEPIQPNRPTAHEHRHRKYRS